MTIPNSVIEFIGYSSGATNFIRLTYARRWSMNTPTQNSTAELCGYMRVSKTSPRSLIFQKTDVM